MGGAHFPGLAAFAPGAQFVDLGQSDEPEAALLEGEDAGHDAFAGRTFGLVDVADDYVAVLGPGEPLGDLCCRYRGAEVGVEREPGNAIAELPDARERVG